MRLTDLASVLRDAGLEVVETVGWKTRGADLPDRPDTIICHHTATSLKAKGDLPTLRLLIEGREDLPGPLCQIALSRSGVVHLIAAGKANHAGRGAWRGQVSSARTIGIEAENDGLGKPWPVRQLDAYERLCAALCRYLKVGAERVCGHKEWARPAGRKVDPAGIDMTIFRDRVRSHLIPAALRIPNPPTVQQEDDMARLITEDGKAVFGTDGVRAWHVPSPTVLAALKRTGVYGDGAVHTVPAGTVRSLMEAEK